mmetsp:Transcript_26458/g.40627  ORF Transcript_26458/g.40627 Transcript_26458/m.40627 type:complete len:159 (-) Transcript_26458:43-519(-)
MKRQLISVFSILLIGLCTPVLSTRCTMCGGGVEPACDSQTCEEIAERASKIDSVESELCLAEMARGYGYCGCPPGRLNPCELCPDGMKLINKDLLLTIPSGAFGTCRDLDFMTKMQHIPTEACQYIRDLAQPICCGPDGADNELASCGDEWINDAAGQ